MENPRHPWETFHAKAPLPLSDNRTLQGADAVCVACGDGVQYTRVVGGTCRKRERHARYWHGDQGGVYGCGRRVPSPHGDLHGVEL